MKSFTIKHMAAAAVAVALLATSAASLAAGRAYDLQSCAVEDNDPVCVSWNLQTAPGASRTAFFSMDMEKDDVVFGKVTPRRSRYTTTRMYANPGVEVYVAVGRWPSETSYDCRMTEIESCRVAGRNLGEFRFLMKANDDVRAKVGYVYTTAN